MLFAQLLNTLAAPRMLSLASLLPLDTAIDQHSVGVDAREDSPWQVEAAGNSDRCLLWQPDRPAIAWSPDGGGRFGEQLCAACIPSSTCLFNSAGMSSPALFTPCMTQGDQAMAVCLTCATCECRSKTAGQFG